MVMDDAIELWAGSVRRYHERRRQEARALWHAFHISQAERHRRALGALVAYHEAEAEKYRDPDAKENAA